MFDSRKFFDLRKTFTVPKILVHKMFDIDIRKISRTPFLDLMKNKIEGTPILKLAMVNR